MATQNLALNTEPKNVNTELSLVVGTTYSGQYFGSSELRFIESVNAPDGSIEANVVLHLENMVIIPKAGEGVYVWVDEGEGILVVNEVQ